MVLAKPVGADDVRAEVAGATDAVAIAQVQLVLVLYRRAVVAGVAKLVDVGVGLVVVDHAGAVVTGVTDEVAVGVELVVVGDQWAVVAGEEEREHPC